MRLHSPVASVSAQPDAELNPIILKTFGSPAGSSLLHHTSCTRFQRTSWYWVIIVFYYCDTIRTTTTDENSTKTGKAKVGRTQDEQVRGSSADPVEREIELERWDYGVARGDLRSLIGIPLDNPNRSEISFEPRIVSWISANFVTRGREELCRHFVLPP